MNCKIIHKDDLWREVNASIVSELEKENLIENRKKLIKLSFKITDKIIEKIYGNNEPTID